MPVHKVSSVADFDAQIQAAGGKLVVIDFFTTWCGPCKVIGPKVEEMSEKHGDVVFLKVDVDEIDDLATKYEIRAMPTFIFLKEGKQLEKFEGANESKLKETVEKYK